MPPTPKPVRFSRNHYLQLQQRVFDLEAVVADQGKAIAALEKRTTKKRRSKATEKKATTEKKES